MQHPVERLMHDDLRHIEHEGVFRRVPQARAPQQHAEPRHARATTHARREKQLHSSQTIYLHSARNANAYIYRRSGSRARGKKNPEVNVLVNTGGGGYYPGFVDEGAAAHVPPGLAHRHLQHRAEGIYACRLEGKFDFPAKLNPAREITRRSCLAGSLLGHTRGCILRE